MFVVTGQISIDKERSLKFNELFIQGGSFIGDRISGHMYDSILRFDCDSLSGEVQNINVYLDIFRRSFILKFNDISDTLSERDIVHIGGVLYNCKTKSIDAFIEQEDPCLEYKRGFDSSFSMDFFDRQEVINTCESLKKEFTDSFNTDYNINEKGDGIILDCRVYGNEVLVDGNINIVDGSLPKPNCQNT